MSTDVTVPMPDAAASAASAPRARRRRPRSRARSGCRSGSRSASTAARRPWRRARPPRPPSRWWTGTAAAPASRRLPARPAVTPVVSRCGVGLVGHRQGLHVVEEGAQRDAYLIVLDEEGIVAVRAVELHRAGRQTGGASGGHDLLALVQRIEDVALDADGQHGRAHAAHRRVRAAAPAADVVQVHGLGEQQVGVGVEAADELVALVLEVALHLEPLPQREAVERLDDLAAELAGEDVVAAEGDLADHARDRQRLVGAVAGRGVVVVAAPPARVHADHATAGRPPRDLLRAGRQRGGDRDDRTRTRSGYITAHSSTCIPPIEPPTTLCQRRMPRWSASAAWVRTQSRTDTTGKRLPHGSPSSGCGLAGPVVPWQPPSTLAQTTNQRSVSIALPGPMRPSHHPARRVTRGQRARGVAVAGEGVADEDGVRRVGGEGAPRLVGDA